MTFKLFILKLTKFFNVGVQRHACSPLKPTKTPTVCDNFNFFLIKGKC